MQASLNPAPVGALDRPLRFCLNIIVLTLLIAPLPAGAYPKMSDRSKYGALDDAELNSQIRRAARFRHLRRRILRHSYMMLGAHYRPDPLGEGPSGAVDKDRRFGLAPVDCLTFVETTLALALAGDLSQARRWLDRLRYSGNQVDYAARNHFMLAQWLPHLQRQGVLRDITRRFGGEAELVHHYAKMRWDRIAPRFLPAHFDRLDPPTRETRLPLLSLDTLRQTVAEIPSGTILLLARVARPRIPVRISHLGFVIQQKNGGRAIFRHASQEGWGRVVDEDLLRYLERLDERSRWAIQGVNLQLPRHPRRLPAALLEDDS